MADGFGGNWGSSTSPLAGDQTTGGGGGSPMDLSQLGLTGAQQSSLGQQLQPPGPFDYFGGVPAPFPGVTSAPTDQSSIPSSLGSLANLFAPGAGTALGLATGLGTELGSLFGNFGGGAGATAGGQQGGQWGGLLGGLPGAFLGELLGSWIGGGVPEMAKPQAAIGALNARGGISSLLAQYLGQGVGRGYDLSGSNVPFNPGAMASALQLLSGQSLGEGPGGTLSLGNLGFGSPVTMYGISNLPQLQGRFPNAPTLQLNQLQQIMPMLSRLANQIPGNANARQQGNYWNNIFSLANKLKAAESY